MENKAPKESSIRIILKVLICIFALITLGGSLLGYSLFQRIRESSNIELNLFSKAEKTPSPIYSQAEIDKFMTNVLIVVQNQPMSTASAPADMVFAVSFNAFEQKLTVISLAHEMLIKENGEDVTLGNVYIRDGAAALANVLNENLGLGIQHYACTDTHSLAAMIDLIGGIELRISRDESDYINNASGSELSYGKIRLGGNQAMVHALNKAIGNYTTAIHDRRLELIEAAVINLRATATKESMLPLLSLVFSNIQTDMDIETLRGIGYEILKAEDIDYSSFYLPLEGTWEYPSSLDEENREVYNRDLLISDINANAEYIKKALFSAE